MSKDFSETENVIFARSFIHWRTKKRIYPKNGEVFVFRPKTKKKHND